MGADNDEMNGIESITRFVAYFPDASKCGTAELAGVCHRIGLVGLAVVRNKPYLLAVQDSPNSITAAETKTLLDVFPGTASSSRLAARKFDVAAPMDVVHQSVEASAQFYNLIRASSDTFELESDMLGLKPAYLAKTPAGTLLASRIDDVLFAFPGLAQGADPTALYELLGFWVPLGQRTLYANIRRTLPGGCYKWTPSEGMTAQARRRLEPAAADPYRFMDQSIRDVLNASRDSMRDKTANGRRPVWLALSGGFDSRFMAALCKDLNLPLRAVTYGRKHHHEMHSAKAVAQVLGIDLTVLRQDPKATLRYLPAHLDATEGTADCGAVSILNLLSARAALGGTLLHGFCGDLLSGGHIDRFRADAYASRDAMADAIVQSWYPASSDPLRELFTRGPDLDTVRQDVFDGLRSDCSPYEAYILWYAENRTRRYVASQLAVLGEYFDMVAPFYDRQLFSLWFSVPPVGLSGQNVLKQLFAHTYPDLARIPHSEQSSPIIPNLRWQMARFYHSLPRRTLNRCIGTAHAERLVLRLNYNADFRSLDKLLAPRQQAHMLSAVAALQPALHKIFDIDLSAQYRDILSTNRQALRGLFTVMSYAARQVDRAAQTNERASAAA